MRNESPGLREQVIVVQESLQNLIIAATGRSADARLEVARSMADLRIPDAHRLTEMDRAQMSGIIAKLIHSIEIDIRLNLADALPAVGPKYAELIQTLADDRIEIAHGLLEHHPSVLNETLIGLVKARSDEHRLILALREQAAHGVQLLHNGKSQDVIETLLRHREPVISRRAMEYLVAETKRADRFEEPILSLSELPGDILDRLIWMVTAALRAPLRDQFRVAEDELDKALQASGKRLLLEQGEQQTLLGRAQRLVHQLDEAGELSDAFLLRCLRQQRVYLFVAGLAQRADVNFHTVWQIFTDRSLKSIAVLVRSIGMSREAVSALLLALADGYSSQHAHTPEIAVSLLTHYDEISIEQANRALHIWKRDPGYQAALDLIEVAS
jgi:uncharacterized protein (DUF2336 family)